VDIDFDPAKRDMVLRERGIDFASAAEVFAGLHATASDDRRDYGEARRIISMRYAHAKENRRWRASLD
jgi:uncharacterized DUF497 family protein